jgi:hypothetical protein
LVPPPGGIASNKFVPPPGGIAFITLVPPPGGIAFVPPPGGICARVILALANAITNIDRSLTRFNLHRL